MNFTTHFSYTALLILFFISILPNHVAQAQSKTITINDDDMNVTFTERKDKSDVLRVITTRKGSVDLMLTETDLLIQFSDKGLDRINKEMNKDPEDTEFAEIIKSMVSSGVRSLLDRAMVIPFYEISEISYESGRLIIRNQEGSEIFKDIEVDDTKVMDDFSRHDARQFVADAEKRLP